MLSKEAGIEHAPGVCVCVRSCSSSAAFPAGFTALLLYCFTALLLLDCSQTGRQGAPRLSAAAASGFTALLLLYCCFTAALLLLYCSLKKETVKTRLGLAEVLVVAPRTCPGLHTHSSSASEALAAAAKSPLSFYNCSLNIHH